MRGGAAFPGVPCTDGFPVPTVLGGPVVVGTSSRRTAEMFRPAAAGPEGLTRRERVIVAAARVAGMPWPHYFSTYVRLDA